MSWESNMNRYYHLVPSTKAVLEGDIWIAGFSGGKDSTAMVTWIEWLRRSGQLKVEKPILVRSDTTVEFPFLVEIAEELEAVLRKTGWECHRVTPRRKDRLYVKIFGQGTTPVNPGYKRMRWCTQSTKISPMKRFRKTRGKNVMALTAIRWGESTSRDRKIQATCSAGGECGVVQTSSKENIFGPILEWTISQVITWLSGTLDQMEVRQYMTDIFPLTKRLLKAYSITKDSRKPLPLIESERASCGQVADPLRFGCVGCPAIANDKVVTHNIGERPEWEWLRAIQKIWDDLRLPFNRCCRMKNGELQYGPIKMEVRKKYFLQLLEIQERSGVTLVTEKDIALIHKCWKDSVYPRGWSEADELSMAAPNESRLF